MSETASVPDKPAEMHFDISRKAAEALGLLLDGNGLRAGQVRLARHDTVVHQLPALLTLRIIPEITRVDIKGRAPRGTVLERADNIDAEIAALTQEFLSSADIPVLAAQHVLGLPGQGFGADIPAFALGESAAKEFCTVDKCKNCDGTTTTACRTCNQQGRIACTACNGGGYSQCVACYGTGQLQKNDGSRMPCGKCNGQGRLVCVSCTGQRLLPCPTCAGSTKTACNACARSGYITHISQVTLQAEGKFALDTAQIPQEIQALIKHLGGPQKLATDNQIEIFPHAAGLVDVGGHVDIDATAENAQDNVTEQAPPAAAGTRVVGFGVPYVAFFPTATAEVSIEGRFFPLEVAGLQGSIVGIEPLMDKMVKPGINALFKLSKGPMAAEALVATACKFRMLREVIAGLAHHPKGYVYKKLLRDYPLVLSDKYAKAAIRYADIAMLALGDGPRRHALMAGSVVSVLITGGYFATPARGFLVNFLTTRGLGQHILIADTAVWVAAYALTLYMIRKAAARALEKLLPPAVQRPEDKGLPSAGQEGLYALLTTFIIWFAAACLAPDKALWVQAVLAKIGLGQ